MPSTHIALFRGINVGKAKRVAMSDLKALIEGLGYRDVRTLLNSGNVVFTSTKPGDDDDDDDDDDVASRIEKAMEKKLGVASRVTVLTAEELARVVKENPLLEVANDHARFLIAVLRDPADRKKIAPLAKQSWGEESLALGKRVAYIWCAGGILDSAAANAVNRALGDGVTARNWTTMQKLHALACG
jgi:uncharacterized protein (DUF1697 family)